MLFVKGSRKMEGLSKRNDALDLLKLFSSFMIILIHVPFYGIGLLLREYREKVIGTKISTCVGMITIGVIVPLYRFCICSRFCFYTRNESGG